MDEIVTDKDVLRTESLETSLEEVSKLNLAERLSTANQKAWTCGCGLAAIQIGVYLRFAWFKFGGEEFTLMNPRIIKYRGGSERVKEGCLSIPDTWTMTKRFKKITYESNGEILKAKGMKAQIIQHEIDHMNGVLNIDKVKRR